MAEKEIHIAGLDNQLSTYFNNSQKSYTISRNGLLGSYLDNTFNGIEDKYKLMFNNGQGDELERKARSIHSSSMLGFNFFHWITDTNKGAQLALKEVVYSKVYFEVQLPTLQGSNFFANMDIVLEGIDEENRKTLLFIESKFTEHEGNGYGEMDKMLRNSYSHNGENRYFPYFPTNTLYAESYWHKLISSFDPSKNSGYLDGIKQEICHMIALSNLKNDESARIAYKEHYKDSKRENINHPDITGKERFIFYNVLFDWKDSQAFKDYKRLYDLFKEEVKTIPSCKSIELNILSYKDIYESMPESDLKDYLYSRYIQFSR